MWGCNTQNLHQKSISKWCYCVGVWREGSFRGFTDLTNDLELLWPYHQNHNSMHFFSHTHIHTQLLYNHHQPSWQKSPRRLYFLSSHRRSTVPHSQPWSSRNWTTGYNVGSLMESLKPFPSIDNLLSLSSSFSAYLLSILIVPFCLCGVLCSLSLTL